MTSSKHQSNGRGRKIQKGQAAQRPRRQSMAPARFKDSFVTQTLERVHLMKKATRLPYDLPELQWDSSHRQNDTHTYCYCGKFGSWFKSMVQVNDLIVSIFLILLYPKLEGISCRNIYLQRKRKFLVLFR